MDSPVFPYEGRRLVPQPVIASAPASVMLFGEHVVLRKGTAIVAAIDCRTQVAVTPRTDALVYLSSALGQTTTSLQKLSFGPRFRFVEQCFRAYQKHLKQGVDVTICSSINPTVGLASSASVTVALLAALREFLLLPFDRHTLLLDSLSVIRSVQGHGSGADAASIIYGGVISYMMDPLVVTPLLPQLPIVLVYSGKKTPTPEVIRFVNDQEAKYPELFSSIFSGLEKITIRAISSLNDLPALGLLMNRANGFMEALGVGTAELSSICWTLRKDPSIFGAKISGSGLGDAAIGLGTLSIPMQTLPSTVSSTGVLLHE
jgi:mevalonate kinase